MDLMNRREFIEKSCLSGLAIVVGSTVLGSMGISTLKASSRKSVLTGIREIPLMLEDTPELQQVGGAYRLEIEDLDKDILIVRHDTDSFVAVDIKCTHKGCQVAYKQEMEKPAFFECPCHGSKFDLTGKALSGPAKTPLGTYETKVIEGELIIIIPVEEDGAIVPTVPVDSMQK
jgi:cytochrome b6-f complex iron-sulfur subunit